MEIFSRISEWLKVQHVVAYCVSDGVSLWCANAFYVFDPPQSLLPFNQSRVTTWSDGG